MDIKSLFENSNKISARDLFVLTRLEFKKQIGLNIKIRKLGDGYFWEKGAFGKDQNIGDEILFKYDGTFYSLMLVGHEISVIQLLSMNNMINYIDEIKLCHIFFDKMVINDIIKKCLSKNIDKSLILSKSSNKNIGDV